MGDIPFGISYYSADVFSRPNEFMLDWFGGAPPEPLFKDDAFTQKWGQNWGIPLYRWSAMRANNFQWWREGCAAPDDLSFVPDRSRPGILSRLCVPVAAWRNREFLPLDQHQMLERTGGRAPHFIPRDDDTPENREANKREGEEYLRVVLEGAGAARVVGEDLGVVPEYVRPNLRYLGIGGSRFHSGKCAMG
jgi:4-alpha-glucanotransferase